MTSALSGKQLEKVAFCQKSLPTHDIEGVQYLNNESNSWTKKQDFKPYFVWYDCSVNSVGYQVA